MAKSDPSGAQNKQRKKKPLYRRIIRGFFATLVKLMLSLFLICVITGCIVGTSLALYVIDFYNNDPEIDPTELEANYTTIMYANDPDTGEQYELIRLYAGGENRIWCALEEIPKHTQDAFIAIEDHTFWDHAGVNWMRTLYAVINEIVPLRTGERQGGSTITQQLIKNITGDDEISPKRKIEEIVRALKMERNYSKADILESYLNTIHLGNGTNGVEAAANFYFDKSAAELTLGESAMLAGMTRSPSYYDPIRNKDNNEARRIEVLDRMYELGWISEAEYTAAVAEKMEIVGNDVALPTYSYFVDTVFNDVAEDLVEAGRAADKTEAVQMIYGDGLRIYTTIDESVQDLLESLYETEPGNYEGSLLPKEVGPITQTDPITGEQDDNVWLQSATIVLDLNGQIKGVVGGRGEKTGSLDLNRAESTRQPGSTMKPIAVYGPAIELGRVNWSTVIEDSPIILEEDGEQILYPQNYNRYYRGNVTVEYAICDSINTVAVKVVRDYLTPQVSFDYVTQKLGISSLVGSGTINDVDIAPMALGAVTHGISLREMTAAYAPFANGGYYNEPISYTRVTDFRGEDILVNEYTPTEAFSPETATIVNKLLQRNVTSGTGSSMNLNGWQMAGKTGTTNENKDYWWIGMSPYYVVGTWVGYDTPESYNSNQPALLIWPKVMRPLHEDLEKIDFPVWGDVVQQTFCYESGMLAGPYCPTTYGFGNGVGWYKASDRLSTCTMHYLGYVPEDKGTWNSELGRWEEDEPLFGEEGISDWWSSLFGDSTDDSFYDPYGSSSDNNFYSPYDGSDLGHGYTP